jgi:protein-L-isoaspartate O-methyltransferase
MVLPLGPPDAQRLTVIDKTSSGESSFRQHIPVRFSELETVR